MNSIQLKNIVQQFGTPVWVYDANKIHQQIDKLKAFPVIRYAQKASSNIHILRLMRSRGVKVDAVSYGELQRSLTAGYAPEDIVFTSDVIAPDALACVLKHNIAVNAGSIDMLHAIGQARAGHAVWLRINPGFGHGHSQKTNTGGEHSKHGIWHSEIAQALKVVRDYNLKIVGLHVHIGSGVDYSHLEQVSHSMECYAKQVIDAGFDFHAISAGGGLSIPYDGQEDEVDTQHYYELWHATQQKVAQMLGHDVDLEIEPGRYLVAQSCVLLTKVLTVKSTPLHQFALVDTGFNSLIRPAFYGAYHEIVNLSAESEITEVTDVSRAKASVVVGGPLCEAGDLFTITEDDVILNRELPTPIVGDILAIKDVGAYGSSMSSNYNSYGLAPEVMINGAQVQLIRRGQTIDDLLSLEIQ